MSVQELADWKRRTSDSEDALQKKVQDLEERLAAAASSQQSHRINLSSSHDNPDPPGVFKQPFSDEVGGQRQPDLHLRTLHLLPMQLSSSTVCMNRQQPPCRAKLYHRHRTCCKIATL